MKTPMTKTEANAFQKRWEEVNRAEREELQKMSPIDKLRQLEALMASVDSMGWHEALAEEESEVRERWIRLRKAYLA
jgi:hypothetical protein